MEIIFCPYCNKESNKMGIKTHIWRVHGEGKNFNPNRGYEEGTRQGWNKGLNKNIDKRIEKRSETYKQNLKDGKAIHPMLGKKHSEETKKKISKSRRKYLEQNPDKVPYLINHSSNDSYPELIFIKALEQYKICGWVHKYRNGIYQYDFAFPSIKLDIEIDGGTHNQNKVKKIDKQRDIWSYSQGWEVLRFTTLEIRHNLDLILLFIKNKIENLDIYQAYDIYESPCNLDYQLLDQLLKQIDKNRKQSSLNQIKDTLINSNIDFSKTGWVRQVSKILGITDQKVTNWMRRNMYDFWLQNCKIRKHTKL